MALAKWYKIDFHTHTPESKCFPDKKVTPKEWLKSAKESGINAVVVSDHNSVGWISKIEEVKSEFEDENFKVFYGIELCVSSDFTHFLIIFDDKMSVTEIEDAVVSNLGLLRKDWADTTINVSEDRLKTLCTELREKIFVIPAHFASNKGLGKSAENAIKKYQEFLLFSAVEVRNEEDVREYNNKLKNKIDFYGQKEIFNLIDEDDNIANQTMSPLVKMIDDKVSADMYSYSDEIDSAILNMQKYSDEFKSNRKKIKELPTIKAEIEKADTILKKFKASGIEESRKDFENIDNKIKNVEKSFASELNAVTVAVASFEEQNRGLDNQMEALDISVENAIELEVIEKLKSINQSLIEILNHKKESVETLKREYEISTTYEKREEIHRKYLNALDEVKNTGGEDINAIQDQLQKNKKRYDDLMSLQNEQGNIEKKIEESIDNFIDKRIELSKKRQAVIDNLKLENISIKVIPLGHLARWKANLQKEFGKEGTFDNDFQNLADKVLSKDNSWEQYRAFLKFMLITDSGNVEKFLNCSTDTRFAKLWTDKYNNDTLSSMIKVLPEDKLQIKIIDENGEIDINEGSPGQKSAAILAFILNSGENPLIIDQPEDDLDNSLIYSLVVKSIRKMKSKRQIIIVTHNPNIPVLGDAEGIIVLERNNQGKVTFRKGKKAGCIEEKLIREGICEIMEGGEDAFRKRERKYQYN